MAAKKVVKNISLITTYDLREKERARLLRVVNKDAAQLMVTIQTRAHTFNCAASLFIAQSRVFVPSLVSHNFLGTLAI